MATENLAPDAIISLSNLTGTVSAIQDDPASPDANWLTMSPFGSGGLTTECYVSFPTPSFGLTSGVGLQTFKIQVRKTNFTQNPSVRLELWENGSTVSTVIATTLVTSTTGTVLSGTWNSSGRVAANIEAHLYGTLATAGGTKGSVEVGAVQWIAATSTTLPLAVASVTGTFAVTATATVAASGVDASIATTAGITAAANRTANVDAAVAITAGITAAANRTAAVDASISTTATATVAASRTANVDASVAVTASATVAAASTQVISASIASTFGASAAVNPSAKSLTDNFASQDSTKWHNWGADVSIDSGRLHINTSAFYWNLTAAARYDLTGSSVMFELVQTPNMGNGSTQAFLDLALDANNDLEFLWEAGGTAGNIIPRLKQGGSFDSIPTAYDATNHRWLRISESGGNIIWATSANGTSWSTLRTIANPFNITSLSVTLYSGYYGTETSPGYALFDNVNIVPADVAVSGTATVTVGGQLLVGADVSDALTFASSSVASRTANADAVVTATATVSPAAARTANVDAAVSTTGSVTAAAVSAVVADAAVPITGSITTVGTRTANVDAVVVSGFTTTSAADRTANVDVAVGTTAAISSVASLAAVVAVATSTSATVLPTATRTTYADVVVSVSALAVVGGTRTAYGDVTVSETFTTTVSVPASAAVDADVSVPLAASVTGSASRTVYADVSVPVNEAVLADAARTASADATVATTFATTIVPHDTELPAATTVTPIFGLEATATVASRHGSWYSLVAIRAEAREEIRLETARQEAAIARLRDRERLATVPSSHPLVTIYAEAREEIRIEEAQGPIICPNDGEPLTVGPAGEKFCQFDGFRP